MSDDIPASQYEMTDKETSATFGVMREDTSYSQYGRTDEELNAVPQVRVIEPEKREVSIEDHLALLRKFDDLTASFGRLEASVQRIVAAVRVLDRRTHGFATDLIRIDGELEQKIDYRGER